MNSKWSTNRWGGRFLGAAFAWLVLAAVHGAAGGELPGVGSSFPPMQPFRVRLLRGLWHETYRVEEAVAWRGGGLLAESWDAGGGGGSGWLSPGNQGGGWVWYFPSRASDLAASHLIVVCNINANSFHAAAPLLVDYVQQGGAVLFLGGRWAFGRAYRDSPLAAICPVEFPGQGRWEGSDLVFSPAGVPLTPGRDAIGQGFANLAWDRQPLLFWHHQVIPTEKAKVLLAAGDSPVLVAGEIGAGRVAVFAGTVMGDPQAGQLAFWDWDGWPQIMAATMDWLAEAPAGAGHGLQDETRAAIEALLAAADPATELLEEETPLRQGDEMLSLAAAACHDRASTHFMLQMLAAWKEDIPAGMVEDFGLAARPFADEAMVGAARQLVASGLPYKTALGLRLLGASRVDGIHERLATFQQSGQPEAVKGPALGLDQLAAKPANVVLPAEAESQRLAIRLGALAGLGDLGTPAALSILRAALDQHAAGRLEPTAYVDQLGADHRLYQAAQLGVLRCGDGAAAGPVVDLLMENIYLVARARTEANKPKDRLERVHAALPAALAWQQRLYQELNTLPETVFADLARRIVAEADRRVVPIALAAFADRALPESVKEILRSSPHPAVVALAR